MDSHPATTDLNLLSSDLPWAPEAAREAVLERGRSLILSNEFSAAVEWVSGSLEVLVTRYGDDLRIAEFFSLLANAYRSLGYFERAVEYALRSERAAQQEADPLVQVKALSSLAGSLAEAGEYEQALGHLQRSEVLLAGSGDERRIHQVRANLGWALGKVGRRDEAEILLKEVILWARREGEDLVLAATLESLAGVVASQGRRDEAAGLYREVKSLLSSTPKSPSYAEAVLHLAENLLEDGRPEDALAELGNAGDEPGPGSVALAEQASLRARILERLGRWEEACAAYRRQAEVNTEAARGRGALSYQRSQVERLEREMAGRLERQTQAQEQLIHALATMAEARDGITGAHVRRTSRFVSLLAAELGRRGTPPLDQETIRLFGLTSVLHDIGKIGIPDAILSKPGPLDPEEVVIMRRHVAIGEELIASVPWGDGNEDYARYLREVVASHHERWDGKGYPRGLAGESIPLVGRIMAVADVYDALRSPRPYKGAGDHQTATAVLTENSGRHFDPQVIAAFLSIEGEIQRVYSELQG